MKYFLLLLCPFLLMAQNQKPNVILIVADDLGYGDLSCYGEKTIHTPHVDALAQQGLRFTNAHTTAATCTPSRYSILTGHYNWRRKDTGIADGDAAMVIRPEQTTIADIFKSADYTTAAIGKWHLGLGAEKGGQNWNGIISPGPADIGFDYSFLMAATADRVPCVWIENQQVANYDVSAPIEVDYLSPFEGEPTGKTHPELLTKLKPSPNHGHDQAIVNGISRIGYMKGGGKALWEDEHLADTIIAKTTNFIKNNKNNPFFLYVGTNDIHVPRYPNPRFMGKSGMGYRGDVILQFDATVGEIVKTLKNNKIYDNTLIILCSDNGPVIDDGYQDQAEELLGKHRPWSIFHNHGGKYSNYEAGTRVPFIVSYPKKIKKGTTNALFSQIDLFASLAQFIGKDIPTGVATDSKNYLNTLLGKDKKGRPYVIASGGSLAITDGRWKYIAPSNQLAYNALTRSHLGNYPEEQLYDLKEDPAELANVAKLYPEKVAELKEILNNIINTNK
ncbi:MAG: arylsulfatase [Capnocytophaga sp.]|nr:arylsulfatase [Capnocytophaga sp.]